MGIAQRIHDTIEEWREEWGARLKNWMVSWATKGITDSLEDMLPEQKQAVSDIAKKLIDDPDVPANIKEFLRQAQSKGNPLLIAAGIIFALFAIIPMVESVFKPLGNVLTYKEERLIHSARLDPMLVLTAWRRDPTKYNKLFDDLKDLGWSDERIEALKFISEIIPGVPDLVRMAVREAFTPEIAEKFGQYEDYPAAVTEWGKRQGLSEEWLKRYWAAHWDLPSPSQGFEMLHRGIIDEPTLNMLLRALDVMPYWRPKLIEMSWNVPTRVDIRRFYAMKVIDDVRLRQLYTAFGYHGVDLDNIVEYTKISTKSDQAAEGKALTKAEIYKGVKQGTITRAEASDLLVDLGYDADTADLLLDTNIPQDKVDKVVKERELTKADIISGLKSAIITEDEARALLVELRYSSDDADFLLKIYKATISPPTEPKVKEASKADIVSAVKKGLITPEDGYLMLQDIGFTPEASQFILMVAAEASPFSPKGFTEFKDLTQKYRVASGLEAKPMTEELKKAAAEVLRLTGEVESLKRAVKEEKVGLVQEEVLPAETAARLTALQVKLHRAEAELARAKSEYDKQIAEWRHSA